MHTSKYFDDIEICLQNAATRKIIFSGGQKSFSLAGERPTCTPKPVKIDDFVGGTATRL